MPKAHPKGQKITLDYIARKFSDENEAYLFLESMRWPNGPVCPHCQGTKAYFLQPRTPDRYTRTGHATQRRVYKCAGCRKQFSVLIGTIFEGTKIPVYKWLMAIHMMCAGTNGVAAYELHRTLEITNKSAWFMCHRIRKAQAGTSQQASPSPPSCTDTLLFRPLPLKSGTSCDRLEMVPRITRPRSPRQGSDLGHPA